MQGRTWWILWQLFILAWMVPLGSGIVWFLQHGAKTEGGAGLWVFRMLIVSMLVVAACTVINLWLYFSAKYAGRSGRWLTRGFVWTLGLSAVAILWIRSLYFATGDDFEEHGIFVGWFAYALLLMSFLAFNLMLIWRRAHLRRRHSRGSSRRRSSQGRHAA